MLQLGLELRDMAKVTVHPAMFREELGADFVLDHYAQDISAEVKKITEKRGVDIVFERTGSYDAVWWLSVLFGVLSGLINLPIVEKPVARPAVAAA